MKKYMKRNIGGYGYEEGKEEIHEEAEDDEGVEEGVLCWPCWYVCL